MNENIKEIILKINPFSVDYQIEPPLDLYTEVELEKFAELIAKKCANIYQAIDNGNEVEGTDNYLRALSIHFGIK